ncbi:hypothetical protein AVEN_157248-1 [Araneus ventricosus]|uniref:Uncharacterized protein n=1 Tax=Araneus ventricosus TaxID=182803 RepID=A0A4Y2AGL2_ARAVE|nr:hypothetical protein AVEN_157248-1 [Araneus ventricosus]
MSFTNAPLPKNGVVALHSIPFSSQWTLHSILGKSFTPAPRKPETHPLRVTPILNLTFRPLTTDSRSPTDENGYPLSFNSDIALLHANGTVALHSIFQPIHPSGSISGHSTQTAEPSATGHSDLHCTCFYSPPAPISSRASPHVFSRLWPGSPNGAVFWNSKIQLSSVFLTSDGFWSGALVIWFSYINVPFRSNTRAFFGRISSMRADTSDDEKDTPELAPPPQTSAPRQREDI